MKPSVTNSSTEVRRDLRRVQKPGDLGRSVPKSDSQLPLKLPIEDTSSGSKDSNQDTSLPSVENLSSISGPGQPPAPSLQSQPRTVEEKRILIRKQLIILLHAIVCKRREHNRGSAVQTCNVPFCGTMKSVLYHMNSCKSGRNCTFTHCASSRQILVHWKYCVNTTCSVCVSLREMIPTSLLSIFANPLCRSEIMLRVARNQSESRPDQTVPEIMESEE